MTNAALRGKPDAGNPHVRFDEGEVAPAATPRRGSLLYKARHKLTTGVVTLVGCVVSAASVTFPAATGDIASNGDDGWKGAKPGATGFARFATNNGSYTAGDDVQFRTFLMSSSDGSRPCNMVFNLDSSGNHTVKVSNVYIGNSKVSATLNGGVWDLSVAESETSYMNPRTLAASNFEKNKNDTTLTLAKGCIITNAATVYVAYESTGNTLRITDTSRVYADATRMSWNSSCVNGLLEVSSGGVLKLLNGNFIDTAGTASNGNFDTTNRVVVTGAGSKIECPSIPGAGSQIGFSIGNAFGRNSLLVEDGGELVAPFGFRLGNSNVANNNRATFRDGAKFTLRDVRVGEYGSCGNALEFLSGSTGAISNTVYVGGYYSASTGNTLVVRNATLSCPRVRVSWMDGSSSNGFYIAGSDSSFTSTITGVSKLALFEKGAHNTFEMSDGAEWGWHSHMQLDDAASSNTIRLVRNAHMILGNGGGLYSGENAVRSCGNRVYIGDGAWLTLAFIHISRSDNVFTVSNATITANGNSAQNAWGVRFGNKPSAVDESGIDGNGLVLQGEAPKVDVKRDIKFLRGSFLRFEVPGDGYADSHVPITAKDATWDDSSSLEITCPSGRIAPGSYMLISTTDGISIPAATLAAANAGLAAQNCCTAKLSIVNGGRELVLKVAKGLMVLFR